jgi:hypothetical protein
LVDQLHFAYLYAPCGFAKIPKGHKLILNLTRMKLQKFLLLAFLAVSTIFANAAWDVYKSGLSLNGGYYDCQLNTAAPDFQNSYFGRYTTSGSLTLDFSEVLTYKNGASDVCSANLYYRVYRTCDTPPAFSSLSLPFCCNYLETNACSGGSACGPDLGNTGDQKWRGLPGSTVNLINGLTLSGTYIIEVYYDITGSDAGGCASTKYSSNGGANYRAYFEFEMNDNFTDLNFNTPTWNGDVANFSAIANSTCSGLTGSENFRTHTVRLNVGSGSGTQHISTQIATWDAQQEWYFWIGRNGIGGSPSDFDANNQQAIYLYSTASDLESSINGYRILVGQTGTSFIRLQRIDGGTATTIFTSSTGVPIGLTDYGISFRVTRSQLGVWTIRTSTLPTNGANTQSTPTPNSCPEVLSTVNHGNVTDNTYAPASNGHFGFMAIHDATTEGRQAAEFDNVRMRALPPDTYLSINGSVTGTVQENVNLAGNYAVGVDITNPSSTVATSIDVVLTSGAAGRIGGGPNSGTAYGPSYTTQTLTWAAGTSGTKYIYIDPNNNGLCDDIETLVFTLQNAVGGTNAFVNTPSSLTLTIVDDDMGYETLVNENFNGGSVGSWVTTGTSWSASTSTPLEGSHSARHSTQGTAGQSSLTYPVDDASLTNLNTTWRFEVGFANDATANNNFQVFLTANKDSLFSSSDLDGYAVVVDQSSLPSVTPSDFIRLYRVDNGAYSATPIVNSTTDWINNVSGGTRVGFEVTLNESGTWNLKIDANGGFDALVSLGTGTDLGGGGLTYPDFTKFGIRLNYLAAASDLMRFDNISVTQSGCKELYYSRATGNSTGAIWSTAPAGAPAPAAVTSGRWDRFVIQSGHNVTAIGDWLINDLTIQNGATLTGGASEIKVHGNWINEGSFVSNTSTVVFKGAAAQSIGFAANAVNTEFNNLTIDNDGFSVTIDSAAVTMKGVVSMIEGTLNTAPGGLTLLSSASGSASIGRIHAGAVVSGNVTLQRYLPPISNSQGYWMNIGNPLTGGLTIADWNDDITTTGFAGSDFPWYPFNNIQYYNESVTGLMNVGYVPATNVTNTLETSRGYFIWIEGASDVISTTGQIQSGTFTQALSHTTTGSGVFHDGWNMMVNSYPSEVDWNLISSTLTGPRVYYVYDYEGGAYKFRNAATNTGTASRYIAHSQSFLVKVNTPGQSLNYQEINKTNTGASFERSEDSQESFISFRFSSNGKSDESLILFNENATSSYDETDVLDLESPIAEAVEFSFLSNDEAPLAQDSRPFSTDIHIPVHLDMPSSGNYVFEVVETQNLPIGSCLYLEDLISGEIMAIEAGAQILISTNAPFTGTRLVIHGTAPAAVVHSDASCHGLADGTIDITTPNGNWSVSLSSGDGNFEYVSNGSVTFDHLPAGAYALELMNAESTCGAQVTTVTIQEPLAVNASVINTSTVTCNNGQTGDLQIEVAHASWFTYEIFNESGALIRTGEVEGDHLIVDELTAGVYSIHIFTTCSNELLNVDLRDLNAITAVVSTTQGNASSDNGFEVTLNAITTNATQVAWNLSNGMSAEGEEITLTLPTGEYSYDLFCDGVCPDHFNGAFQVQSVTSNTHEHVLSGLQIQQMSDMIILQYNGANGGQAMVRIFDIQGKEVFNQNTILSPGVNIQLNTSALSAGIYNLHVLSEDRKIFTAQVYQQ